jgi:hypothetical protein
MLMSCNWDVTFGRGLSNEWNWMLTYVNAIAYLYCCIYLMHGLHHNLLGCCNYLMMQSYLWQMVRTEANGDDVLDVPEGSAAHDAWAWAAFSWQCTTAATASAGQP